MEKGKSSNYSDVHQRSVLRHTPEKSDRFYEFIIKDFKHCENTCLSRIAKEIFSKPVELINAVPV